MNEEKLEFLKKQKEILIEGEERYKKSFEELYKSKIQSVKFELEKMKLDFKVLSESTDLNIKLLELIGDIDNTFLSITENIDFKEDDLSLLSQKIRDEILERDNYSCILCKNNNRVILNVHHIIPRNVNKELINDKFNLITLCLNCHKQLHNNIKQTNERVKSEKLKLIKERLEEIRLSQLKYL